MKIKKRTLKIVCIFFVLIIAFLIIYLTNKNKEIYKFEDNSFSYSKNRGELEYSLYLKSKNSTFDIYYLNFKSRNFLDYEAKIYGLVLIPNGKSNFPGLILLPGGAVKKESELNLAVKIAEMGICVFTFDQRGIGETGGIYLGLEQDYAIFSKGNEPIQHLSVFDALRAYDAIKKVDGIDKNNIAIAGESMGGRYAIIAAAIEKRLKGVIVISSSGFDFKNDPSLPYNSYLLSVDPDSYIGRISPNYVFMLQGTNDSVVTLANAENTFGKAAEPKKFFTADGCGHGYCDKMYDGLKEAFDIIYGQSKLT